MAFVALSAVVLAFCDARPGRGQLWLSAFGLHATYYGDRFGGPELVVWQPHDHPRSCSKPVYYLVACDCPVFFSAGRYGVRWRYRSMDPIDRLNYAFWADRP